MEAQPKKADMTAEIEKVIRLDTQTINRAEELLVKARHVALAIEQRVRQLISSRDPDVGRDGKERQSGKGLRREPRTQTGQQ
jgi:hypothetical protein